MPEPKLDKKDLNHGALLLDDWMLDAAHDEMLRFARLCKLRYGRKPTLEQFRRLIDVVLCVSGEDYFADGKRLEVTEVVFKTKKRPATQRYKEGDVFAIPLGEGSYAFGRLMRCSVPDRPTVGLIEIFRERSNAMTYRPSIVASGRLLHPRFECPGECLKSRRWTIVASDDAYRFPEVDQQLEFTGAPDDRRGFPRFSAKMPFAPGSPSRPITEDEWRSMEANGQSNGLGRIEDFEDRIREALKKEPMVRPPAPDLALNLRHDEDDADEE